MFIFTYRKLTIFVAVSFYVLAGVQLVVAIIGTVNFKHWKDLGIPKLRDLYLVYMILLWCGIASMFIVTMICCGWSII